MAQSRVSKLEAQLSMNETKAGGPKLSGRCACGAVSWEGIGEPAVTFYCHCSLCRRSGGAAFVGAAAFKVRDDSLSGRAGRGGGLQQRLRAARLVAVRRMTDF
jgi:hypothetical protein